MGYLAKNIEAVVRIKTDEFIDALYEAMWDNDLVKSDNPLDDVSQYYMTGDLFKLNFEKALTKAIRSSEFKENTDND